MFDVGGPYKEGEAVKKLDLSPFRIDSKKDFRLDDYATDCTDGYGSKDEAAEHLSANIEKMVELQEKLYATNRNALLLVFQAMDSGGKDGTIKHVMSGLNPQGTQVTSFKQPSMEELNHDYLWRINKCLPERGRIGIFNRSYYEEVLVVRVHNLLAGEKLPESGKDVWDHRYRQIRDYEHYLYENGILPVKFFLHISKNEQKKRLLERIDDPAKNWKFSAADLKERQYWQDYQKCYQEAIQETGTSYAPWYVVPADKKWFARLVVSEAIVQTLRSLKLSFPKLSPDQVEALNKCKNQLENE